MNYSTGFLAKLKEFEGSFTHMYLDTKGYVTVGVGHLLSSAAVAAGLAFDITREAAADPKAPKPALPGKVEKATAEEIKKDYAEVSKQTKGLKAAAYAKYTKVRLPQTVIDSLLQGDLDDVASGVRSKFAKFDSWPQAAQEAVLDMAFNMGTNFFASWPNFKKAIEGQDWDTASKECTSSDIQKSRNDWRQQQFKDAAAAKPKATK